uniref:Uncharacterized protein n=1 Tax=Anguilla anguilla TaxID=7936 RepID=A0A0E9SYI1_ANGAN
MEVCVYLQDKPICSYMNVYVVLLKEIYTVKCRSIGPS